MEQSDWLCLWVRKEATVKATGQGLAADLTGFTVGTVIRSPGTGVPLRYRRASLVDLRNAESRRPLRRHCALR